jgi:hypothetical protein
MSGSIQERHGVVDLTGDFDEPDGGVQVLADRVLLEGFDFGDGHSSTAEMRKGVLEQSAAQSLTLRVGPDCQIVDPANSCFTIAVHCNVPEDRSGAVVNGNGDLGALEVDVELDVAGLAPRPIAPGNWAKARIDVVVDRNACKGRDRQIAHGGTICFLERSNNDGHDAASYAPADAVGKGLSTERKNARPLKPAALASTRRVDTMRDQFLESLATDWPERGSALSSDVVVYSCPYCRAELAASFDEWDGWLRCPVCARPSNPPAPAGFRMASERLVLSSDLGVAQSGAKAADTTAFLNGSRPAFVERFAHTSPARLVFVTGLVFSLFLALIAFLDQKPTRLSIFGFLSIVFFFLLLRTPGKRVAPWNARVKRDEGTTALKDPASERTESL